MSTFSLLLAFRILLRDRAREVASQASTNAEAVSKAIDAKELLMIDSRLMVRRDVEQQLRDRLAHLTHEQLVDLTLQFEDVQDRNDALARSLRQLP